MQGWEYLDLGRLWQVLLTVGLFFWVFILFRGLRGRAARSSRGQPAVAVLLHRARDPAVLRGGIAQPAGLQLHRRGLLAVLGGAPVGRGLPRILHHDHGGVHLRAAGRRAPRSRPLAIIYLDIILYSVGGVVGTMHHLYFSGTPAETMALGAFFSAAEVIPLTFLTVEAWRFLQLGARQEVQSAADTRSRTGGP